MNKVQIAGVSLILIGIAITMFCQEEVSNLLTGILIGLGVGLTVYRKNSNSNNKNNGA